MIKSKSRVRDHGEVFTPDFIVQDMLDLVMQETERIESRFLEPACGDGNFLSAVLERKLQRINSIYKKSQVEWEKYTLLAIGSIYGVDLLEDNVLSAKERLYNIARSAYTKQYKSNINEKFLSSIQYMLQKNIIQGDALTLLTNENKRIIFSERSLIGWSKIKRREFAFGELIKKEEENKHAENTLFGDSGQPVFIPEPVQEYPPLYFLDIATYEDWYAI